MIIYFLVLFNFFLIFNTEGAKLILIIENSVVFLGLCLCLQYLN